MNGIKEIKSKMMLPQTQKSTNRIKESSTLVGTILVYKVAVFNAHLALFNGGHNVRQLRLALDERH